MTIYYMALEPYPERYTELLTGWVETRARQMGIELVVVLGHVSTTSIVTGRVLDARGRCQYSATQIERLLDHELTAQDCVWFADMFTPGIEALPYVFDQLSPAQRPFIFAQNHAQSVDPDDFTYPMRHWMRHYELLVDHIVDGLWCGSTVHAEMMRTCMFDAPIHVVGLPFDRLEVVDLAGEFYPDTYHSVVYASRLDTEKNPMFFLDLVERLHDEMVFYFCCGGTELRSSDPAVTERMLTMSQQGKINLELGCSKADYYNRMASSTVHLLTSRQDFVSYTLLEASALGTPTLAPAFRSFPETLTNRAAQLYCPWSLDDAEQKLRALVNMPVDEVAVTAPACWHHNTIARKLEVMEKTVNGMGTSEWEYKG
jgi:glycosyltransferase involved in cell wall biosynthesis